LHDKASALLSPSIASDVEEVKHAAKLGMTVIITDHHIPPPVIPDALAIVNPKMAGSQYPFTELAGVGVAFKVMQALLSTLGKEEQMDEQMDLVAIGTVADMVPLWEKIATWSSGFECSQYSASSGDKRDHH
jgi:single-stranded DNA-specific DHH superfamily exonuclease